MKKGFTDYYKILSVSPKANAEEIKRAWRKKMKQFHPDRHLAEHAHYEKISCEINRAYSVLSDETSRQKFDEKRSRALSNSDVPDIALFSFGEKVTFTVLVFCITVFFFAIPPWADCENAFLGYFFAGRAAENIADPIAPSLISIVCIFSATLLCGKCIGERVGVWTFLQAFSLLIACAKSLIVPLQQYEAMTLFGLFGVGVFCVFKSYGERKRPVAGVFFRVVGLIACVLTYRAGTLVFKFADELVSAGCLLVLATYLVAGISARLSAGSE